MPKLVVLSEGLTGRTYELKVEKTTIGRLDDNSFPIAEQSVSSRHCEVLLKDNEVTIRDLNSTNGTYINGEKITEKALKPGQILRLGQIEMRLEDENAPASATKPSAAEKKRMDPNTRVIPRGVKLNEFEQGAGGVKFDKNSAFAKKSNKTNMVFIAVGVVLGLVIISFLVMAFLKMRGE
jgi:pSer/pThr/pTyr-binding forkhead associated (FHA) protein